MRIAQLIDSLYVGGAEKLQVTFMRTALSRGLHPTLITFNCFPEEHNYRQLKLLGVEIIEIRGRSLFDPVLFRKLIQTLQDGQFDVLHTHLTYGIILGGLAGWVTGIPVVASIHNLKPDSWQLLESLALRFFTKRRIAVGYVVSKVHQARFSQYPIDVLLNPVESIKSLSDEERLQIRDAITPDSSRLLIITVGRLIEAKGYSDLLDAIDQLRHFHPEILLVIVGIGEYLQAINAKIESLQLADHVRLLGARADVPELLMASDIYVSASHSEGLPVSILEAMAAELPIVATGVGDIPLVVKPEFGICVPAHQPGRIVEAVGNLIENPDQRIHLGNMARDYVRQHHSPEAWLDQILNIYDQVIPASRKAL